MEAFTFGTFAYEYELILQDRKTLSLTVTPELHIILKCPKKTDTERIEKFLAKKWFWLEKQLSFFKKYQRKIYKKEYVSGESHLYLGRQYKLEVKRAEKDEVIATKSFITLQTTQDISNSSHNRKLIHTWFADKTQIIFQERFQEMLKRFEYKKTPQLSIREMKKRWGSFLNREKIFLNPKLIHTSKACIDYVIVHELCHLTHKNHDKKFWNLLEEKYPKWNKIKNTLETMGVNLY